MDPENGTLKVSSTNPWFSGSVLAFSGVTSFLATAWNQKGVDHLVCKRPKIPCYTCNLHKKDSAQPNQPKSQFDCNT